MPVPVSLPPLTWTPAIGALIDLALQEDLGAGDATTNAVSEPTAAVGRVRCGSAVVGCGIVVAEWIGKRAAPDITVVPHARDGEQLDVGAHLLSLEGPSDAILRVERVMLNFLMRMSGVATLTRQYVDAIGSSSTRVVDTRKTLPGWRPLDKYAVRVGGAYNHRADLGSGVLIKDNHIAACGSVTEAIGRARATAPHSLRIEVEVETIDQARAACEAGAEVVLLDNMSPDNVRDAVREVAGRAIVEISGGITLATIGSYADAGADVISVGALTHSATAADLSLDLHVPA